MTPEKGRRLDPIALLILIRPGNVAITALSVWVAGMISNPNWSQYAARLMFAIVSAALIAAGGNACNDYYDRDLDRLQKPHRPLPAHRLTPRVALWFGLICFAAGLLLAWRLGPQGFSLAAWAGFLLLLYSRALKRRPLIGNVTVALVAALAFVYGGVAVFTYQPALWAAALAFFFHLGREIIKDMEDEPGDRAAGAATLPIQYGMAQARSMAIISFIFLLFCLPLPYYWGHFQKPYLWVVLGGVAPVVVLVAILTSRWTKPEQLHRLALVLKFDMLAGLLALYLGRPL